MEKMMNLQQTRRWIWGVCAIVIGTGLLLFLFRYSSLGAWFDGIGLLLFGLNVLFPRIFIPLYLLWTAGKARFLSFSFTFGLFLVFACLVTPLALARRCMRKDDLSRSFNHECSTYRTYRVFEDDMQQLF